MIKNSAKFFISLLSMPKWVKSRNRLVLLIILNLVIIPSNSSGQTTEEKLSRRATDSIFSQLKQELEVLKREGTPSEIAQKTLEVGAFYQEANLFSDALEQYGEAIQLLTTIERDTLFVILNNRIGQIHFTLKNFELAKGFFEDAKEVATQQLFIHGEATAKSGLGNCYEKTGNYPAALRLQKQSLSLYEKLVDSTGIATAQENIGSIYEDLLILDTAEIYFLKAYKYLPDSQSQLASNILNNLGDVNRKEGDYTDAIRFTSRALEVALLINDNDEVESAYKDLSEVYYLKGDYQEAYDFLTKANEYNELILKGINIEQLNRLQTIYDNNKKEAQIRILTEQNKADRANQRLVLLAVLAGSIILGILYFFNNRKKKAELKEKEYEQRTLEAELESQAIKEKTLHREIQLKTASLSKYSLHIAQKNKILLDLSNDLKAIGERKGIDYNKKIKNLAKEIDYNLQQENEWEEFIHLFKEIHPEFDRKLSEMAADNLSPAELRLGILLRLNLSTKEIASILRITPDSVRVARYRLRKKLPISPKEDLVHFMINL